MKLINSFTQFLADHVNLNKTRVDQADDAFDTLTSFLQNSDVVGEMVVTTSRQGSLRQGTIIKPRTDETEFDVDLLVSLTHQNGWTATDYLDAIHKVFKDSDRYGDLVDRRGKHRCVTIDYANDFHVDIVPSIEVDGQYWIMNRETDEFERTDGDGYADWFSGRNAITGGKQLVRVVRLMKYLRDEHGWPVKSILLTTILGQCVYDDDTAEDFPDTPTGLAFLIGRLEAWLVEQTEVPVVVNPALPEEQFVRHWDEATFSEFRDGVQAVAAKVREAMAADNAEDAVELWRAVFGESFPLSDDDLETTSISAAVLPAFGSASHQQPLSTIATRERIQNRMRLDAWVYDKAGKTRFRGINSGTTVSSGRSIKFRFWTDAVKPYDVWWQVVNTGAHAALKNALRGEFLKGSALGSATAPPNVNWESTQFTGRHWVEAFLVRDGVCIARSGRFLVPIKNPLF